MKTILKIVGLILTLFMLSTPVVTQAYTTGKHNNNKKPKSGIYATKSTDPSSMSSAEKSSAGKTATVTPKPTTK